MTSREEVIAYLEREEARANAYALSIGTVLKGLRDLDLSDVTGGNGVPVPPEPNWVHFRKGEQEKKRQTPNAAGAGT